LETEEKIFKNILIVNSVKKRFRNNRRIGTVIEVQQTMKRRQIKASII